MLIVPKIEYASVVWCPFDKVSLDLIEGFQRRFTSCFLEYQECNEERQQYVCKLDYWERLKDLKIYSLQRRRERFAILYMYRILIGLITFQWFEPYEERGIKFRTKYNRRANPKIRRVRHSSFFYKGPQLWNLLPQELREFEAIDVPCQTHVDIFKAKLDKFIERVPDQPNVPNLNRFRVAATNSLICQIPVYRRQQQQIQLQNR